jgi:hypothetical protein
MATQPTWRSSRVNVLCGEQQTSKQSRPKSGIFTNPISHGGAGEQLLDDRPVDEDEAGEFARLGEECPELEALLLDLWLPVPLRLELEPLTA